MYISVFSSDDTHSINNNHIRHNVQNFMNENRTIVIIVVMILRLRRIVSLMACCAQLIAIPESRAFASVVRPVKTRRDSCRVPVITTSIILDSSFNSSVSIILIIRTIVTTALVISITTT